MNEAIQQQIQFKGATAAGLFDIFLDPEKHSAIIGGQANISRQENDPFSLMDGHIKGKNLKIVPGRMIVQTWRGNVWHEDDLDSVLILVFSDTDDGAQIDLVHAFTPEQFTELWDQVYWQPIRAYLDRVHT